MSSSSRHNNIVSKLILAGMCVTGFGLLAGYLGSSVLELDILSHFRLHFIGFFIVLALANVAPARLDLIIILVGAISVPVGIAMQSKFVPSLSITAVQKPAVTGKIVSIVSYNTWLRNKDWRTIVKHLRKLDADFVVLLEFGASKKPLFQELKKKYPYQKHCSGQRGCHVALLSKHRWVKSGLTSVSRRMAPTVWAQFGPELNGLTVIGTHVIRPPYMSTQMRQLETLARKVRGYSGPVIAAGDFNATPWSHMLSKFIAASKLHTLIGSRPTWPVANANLPQIPIDHIFVSKGLTSLKTTVGPRLGSDHLPIYSKIQLSGS